MTQEFYYKNTKLYQAPFYVWGIVNLTPDSFYDGGKHFDSEENSSQSGILHANKLLQEGASILDIGGASSRPNAKDIPSKEEWQRIESTLLELVKLKAKSEKTPILSLDTWRADVAQKALEAGADIINDISAFSWEESLLDVVTEHKAGYVLMHCQGTPKNMQNSPTYQNIVEEVMAFFEHKMNKLVQKGLPEDHIILDLGIGFGKNVEHNLMLLQNVEKFHFFKRPILLGISHKSFFGHLLGIDPDKRASITQVCTALMTQKNVMHHRVHDVLETVKTLTLQSYIR